MKENVMSHDKPTLTYFVLLALLMLTASPAAAYIGPGAGLGAFAVILALGAGVLLLVVGLVWYPLKRMLKRRKAGQAQTEAPERE